MIIERIHSTSFNIKLENRAEADSKGTLEADAVALDDKKKKKEEFRHNANEQMEKEPEPQPSIETQNISQALLAHKLSLDVLA